MDCHERPNVTLIMCGLSAMCAAVLLNALQCSAVASLQAKLIHRLDRILCRPVLAPGGEVHVTIKLGPPYSEWGVEGTAREAGYVHFDTLPFDAAAYPGYAHVTTEHGAAPRHAQCGRAQAAKDACVPPPPRWG